MQQSETRIITLRPQSPIDVSFSQAMIGQDKLTRDVSIRRISTEIHNHLYGREDEKQQLVELYEKLKTKQQSSPKDVALISGSPGCGKTTLVTSSLRNLVESDGGFFIYGKFEQYESPMPLSAFTTALQQLCDCMSNLEPETLEVLKVKIRDDVGSELELLSSLMPGLQEIMQGGNDVDNNGNIETTTWKEEIPRLGIEPVKQGLAAKRVEFACRKFLRAVASTKTPIVWLLDDLQWADQTSLDFFVSLAKDQESTGILFLTAFRSEPPSNHLSIVFDQLQSASVSLHRIELSGLSIEAVSNMLTDVLKLPSQSESESLSSTLYSISRGNPLFLLELLRSIQEDGLIGFDEETKQWQIDNHLIQVTLEQNESVIDLLQAKLHGLPSSVIEVLKVASCLGSRLDVFILSLLLPDISVEEAISVAVANFLLKLENGRCLFSHDHVQKAAYGLIPDQDRCAFHFKLGRRLLRKLESMDRLDDLITDVVDQLIRGASCLSDKERNIVAALCLRAGTKAVQSQGFPAAAVYLQCGIDLLGRHCWTEDYVLCLQLHNLNAEACYCTANYAQVNRLVAATLENARCFADTLPIRSTQVYALSSMGCLTEAIDSGLSILKDLEEGMEPEPSKLRVILSYWRTKRILSNKSDASLLRLPYMTNTTKLAAMHVLNLMILSGVYARPALFAQIIFKMVRMTVTDGVCAASCVGFAYYGMILSGPFRDIENGYRYAVLGKNMFKNLGSDEWKARVSVAFYGTVHSWKNHLATSFSHLQDAYDTGLRTGDIEYAMLIACLMCWNFYENFNLVDQDKRASQLEERLEFLGHKASLHLLQPYLTWLRCLKSVETHCEATDVVAEYLERMKDVMVPAIEKENPSRYLWARFNALTLSYYFGSFDLAYEFSDCCRTMYEDHNFGATLSGVVLFWECLVFLTIHRECLTMRRRRHILGRIKVLRRWSKYAYENLQGKLFFIEAEFAVAVGDHLSAPSLYFSAILLLRQSGLVVLEALANERAGKYFFSRGEVDQASEHLQEALRLYCEWGSHSKTHHLQTETVKMFGDSTGHKPT